MRIAGIREVERAHCIISEDRRSIEEFSENNNATATDLYMADFYAKMALDKLDSLKCLLKKAGKKTKKSPKARFMLREDMELKKGVFLMVYQALKEHIDKLTEKTDIQITINQKLFDLEEQARKIMESKQNAKSL